MADNRWDRKAAVLARMKAIPPQVRADMRGAVDQQAAFLTEQIRPNVPKDEGELADSVEWHRNNRGDKIGAVITEGANDETLGRKARANEFGRGGDNPMEARPHFFPTYRAFKKRINRALNAVGKRAAGKHWGRT